MRRREVLPIVLLLTTFASCSSSPKKEEPVKYMDKEVAAMSSHDNSRPFWTFDGGWKMDQLRKAENDSVEDPKFAYIVTSDSVKSDNALPQCYAMAKTRASADVGRMISETVKEAKALSQNADESEFQNEINTKAHNLITGFEEVEKFNLKLKGDEDKPVKCWVLMKFPRKTLKTLQGYVHKALEKEAGGNPELKGRVAEATKKMMDEM
jgi:hypothetical protein